MDIEDTIDRLWWATEESTDGCYLTMQRVRRLPAPAGVTPCSHDENGAEWEAQLRDHTRSSSDDPNAQAYGATPREAKERVTAAKAKVTGLAATLSRGEFHLAPPLPSTIPTTAPEVLHA